ncbi:hypothetical protein [Bartonella grahamii]|uniref:hypothetical protein n=1 Tax=Bartonella grahamii TaxID=33045 RepID=UPI00235DD588|nr:hypothetical protein [Bartonella grahamii]
MFVVMKQLLSLGIPLAVGFISQMMISFTDAALVAHLGIQALSGTMLALSMFSFVMLFGARYYYRGCTKTCRKLSQTR